MLQRVEITFMGSRDETILSCQKPKERSRWSFFAYFPKIKVDIKSPTCLSVSPPPTNNFWTDRWTFMKLGKQVMPLKRPRRHIFCNLLASASPKWWTFKFLRWVHRNPLITSEPIAGFGWSLVWRCWHSRWPQLHIIKSRSFNHSKMTDV
jgi:hypothetical protein